MCQLLVGLGPIDVLGVVEGWPGRALEVHVRTLARTTTCERCQSSAWLKDVDRVRLVDLPCYGQQSRLVWHKRRWRCRPCDRTWTETAAHIAAPRHRLTDRAGRWVTEQVGRHGRSVRSVAGELGCDWHTVNTAVIAYGTVLVDDPARIGQVTAIGLDEVFFCRVGRFRRKRWSTSIVDVRRCQLLDVVEGRNAAPACAWLAKRPPGWLARIVYGTLDMSGTYRSVYDTVLPHAVQVADPFHVVKAANKVVDDVRRRVQQEVLGHRGRKHDPLYRIRRLLTIAAERLDPRADDKLTRLLEAGDPHDEVATAYRAKELVRDLYAHRNPGLAAVWIDQLAADFQHADRPAEVRRFGRTLVTWRDPIIAWHTAGVTNGPTEGNNALTKKVKRIAHGMTNFRNWRVRVLLAAGRPDWDLLPHITPMPL